MPKVQGGEKGEEEKQGEMDERERGKKSLSFSDAQITTQLPTDKETERRKKERKREGDGGRR